MRRLLPLLALIAFHQASADTLADVRDALRHLPAKQPIEATLTIQQRVRSEGKYANDSTARFATAEIRHDEKGISVTVPQALLEKAASHPWSSTVGENTAQDAIGTIRTLGVVEALNFRDPLLALLDGAKVLQEKRASFRGAPARLLTLKLAPLPEKSANKVQIGTVKSDDTLTLWIGNENLPLAGERVQKTTAGIMFIKGTYASSMSYTFAHDHDRIVLTRLEINEGGSGLGQSVEKKSIETLTIH